jgi:hypothetical protein
MISSRFSEELRRLRYSYAVNTCHLYLEISGKQLLTHSPWFFPFQSPPILPRHQPPRTATAVPVRTDYVSGEGVMPVPFRLDA